MSLFNFVKKIPSSSEIPEGFSLTGQASLQPKLSFLPHDFSDKRKNKPRNDDDSYVDDKRANQSKVYSALASLHANKKKVATEPIRRGYKKGILSKI